MLHYVCGEGQRPLRRIRPLLEKPLTPGDDIEEPRNALHRLTVPGQEISTHLEAEVEQSNDVLLSLAVKIDQEVAAGDKVEPGEGRVPQHIMVCEEHAFAQLLIDTVASLVQHKELLEAFRRDIPGYRLGIAPLARTIASSSISVAKT
jgi:hypothetical protein